ncbi:MAG: class I SAM-dependent methyltransferase [Candidatus Competibacterales bacterium]
MSDLTVGNPPAPDPRLMALLADYPPQWFPPSLYHSVQVVHRYTAELALDVLRALGAFDALVTWQSPAELGRTLGLVPAFETQLTWLLDWLASWGALEVAATSPKGYRRAPVEVATLDGEVAAWRERLLAIDAGNRPTALFLEAAAAAYPAVAKGQVQGETALLGMGNVDHWLGFFANDNPLYVLNNRIAAAAAVARLAPGPLRILEVGAGTGSATAALLDALAQAGRLDDLVAFTVTEPSPFLRRRAERALKRRAKALGFAPLDIDEPWTAQGLEGPFDLVLGVNVFHVARDVAYSLAQGRRWLTAGGWLVAGECLRPGPGVPVYIEFALGLLDGFAPPENQGPVRGFLTPEAWREAFAAAGFTDVAVTPDHDRTRPLYPRLLVGAVLGRG